MTTIKAECPSCGPATLKPGSVLVTMYQPVGGSYAFACPGCEEIIYREASSRIIDLMIEHGCPYRIVNHPKLERDIEELRDWMANPDWSLLS